MSASNTPENIQELAKKWREGTITPEEKLEFNNWYNSFDDALLDVIANETPEQLKDRMYQGVITKEGITKVQKQAKLWPRIAIAAAVAAIVVSAGMYFYNNSDSGDLKQVQNDVAQNDIAPGKNTATLTLNGSTINLSDAKTGIAVSDDIKYNDGTTIDPSKLGMTKDDGMTSGDSRSLEVSTPRGGTYSIILQDGTKVWLNADSKLEFLSDYRNKPQRIVKLTGEAYFEVATAYTTIKGNRTKQRFIVQRKCQGVEVLGTHFDISAYEGEAIRTTLLEGSVRIEGKLILKPGQQSEISMDRRVRVKEIDPADAIAWKEGYFKFDNEPLASIMVKISRWYNVEVVYQDEMLKSTAFGGTVSRFSNVSQILNKLQLTGKAHFKIEGQKIIVTK